VDVDDGLVDEVELSARLGLLQVELQLIAAVGGQPGGRVADLELTTP
jgi:hypothetical protein